MYINHRELHRLDRIGWLRAAVLGANDGIISIACLMIAVAAAHTADTNILLIGIAGLIAGAMSMAAGEYISVSSQADTEKAEIQREKQELETNIEFETEELTAIYVKRGLNHALAEQVAKELMAHDALGAHIRDELGITDTLTANPLQAALASASSFTMGAILPLIIVVIAPTAYLVPIIFIAAILFLGILGGLAARIGGSKIIIGSKRVAVWGTLAMIISAGVGSFL